MLSLIRSPSGPTQKGNQPGDILVWNGVKWVPSPAPLTSTGGFDYVLRSRADLVAVVSPDEAGKFELPSGAYAIKGTIELEPGEWVSVASDVLLMGMGPSKALVGSRTSAQGKTFLAVSGRLDMIGLTVQNNGGGGWALEVADGAELQARGCRWTAANTGAIGAVVTGGSIVRLAQTRVLGLVTALQQEAGTVVASDCEFSGEFVAAVRVNASSGALTTSLSQCSLRGHSQAQALAFQAASGVLESTSCDYFTDGTGTNLNPVVSTGTNRSVLLRGGSIRSVNATGRNGLALSGSGRALVDGVMFSGVADGVHSGGGPESVTIQGCTTDNTVTVGVDWPSASTPSRGLLIVGCSFDTSTPFQNFNATTSRVNVKACANASGLMSETPIVT